MAKRIYNGECLIRCEYCGAVNTAVWKNTMGYKRWTIKNCTKCNRKLAARRMETVLCPHCGKLGQKDDNNLCLNCGKLVYREDEVFAAECANCGVVNMIPRNHDQEVFCEVCGEKIPADQLKSDITVDNLPAQNIRLKDQQAMLKEDLVMWKHPLHQFSVKSRLQVSEGTWALLLQNGVCQYPYGPGSYLLEETDMGKQAKLDAAADGEDVILNTDIYCVIRTLPGIKWGTGANRVVVQYVDDKKETRDYQILANGELIWNITDPKAFAERFGFRDQLHGTKELVISSDASDSELVKDTRKAIHDALTNGARILAGQENLDPMKLEYHQQELEKQLKIELDRIMDAYGLACGVLKINNLEVKEIVDSAVTLETKRRETIRKAARKDYRWDIDDVKLFPGASQKAYAAFRFSGSARLRIEDEERFFEAPEIQALPDNPGAAEGYFRDVIHEALRARIAPAAQTLVAGNKVAVSAVYLHTIPLADDLKRQVLDRLSVLGLGVESLHIDPPVYTESAELKRANEIDERKQNLIRYAESVIKWAIPSVSIHMPVTDQMPANDQVRNRGLTAQVTFSGDSRLKVADEDRFFRDSRIQGFLNAEPPADEKTVNSYYEEMLRNHFEAKLAGVTQNMINRYGWDIRELPSYTEQLKTPAVDTLNTLISDWGMRAESTYVRIDRINMSEALRRLSETESDGAAVMVDADARRVRNETRVNELESDVETEKKQDDIITDSYVHHAENKMDKMDADDKVKDKLADHAVNDINRNSRIKDATHRDNIRDIENNAEKQVKTVEGAAKVDEANDNRIAQGTERTYTAEDRKQQHELGLARTAEDAIHQMERAEEEHERILEDIRHKTDLDEAQFAKELAGIMHQIDESNLDWRKKLEEYNRMAGQLGVKDAQDARRAVAETDAEIKLLQGKANADVQALQTAANYESGMKNVQLNTAQASLMETIDRYAEDRNERIQAANFARNERMMILGFQQNLEDRKQKADEALTTLKEQHAEAQREREYLARMNEMRAEIDKQKIEMETEKTRIREEAGLGKAQSANEARAKEAEYKYLAEKETERQNRDNDLMDRAEALFRYVQDIQKAMDTARMDLQRHSDDNVTSVRRDYADVEKLRALGMNEQQRAEIIRKLDELERELERGGNGRGGKYTEDDYNKLMKKIKDIMDAIHKNEKSIADLSRKVDDLANSRKCWKCGAAMPRKARFCNYCGVSLIPGLKAKESDAQRQNGIVCPLCGAINEPGTRKCVNCMADLG